VLTTHHDDAEAQHRDCVARAPQAVRRERGVNAAQQVHTREQGSEVYVWREPERQRAGAEPLPALVFVRAGCPPEVHAGIIRVEESVPGSVVLNWKREVSVSID
jgi:hypothetical protein